MENKIFSIIVIAILLTFSGNSNARSSDKPQFEIFSTSIIKRNGDVPMQIGMVRIKNLSYELLDCELIFPGNKKITYSWKKSDKGISTHYFEFPKIVERQKVEVKIRNEGNVVFNEIVQFNPPKIWKIYDVQVSHHDLGYADYYHMMTRDVREMGVEMALEFARKTDNWPKESQFHWTIETSEPMIQFLSKQPENVLDELFRRIKKGQIALGGAHNSVSTDHLGYEAMARQFYMPNRYVCDWFQTSPSKTALNNDIVGFSRALAMYSKEADIPYFMFGRNGSIKEFYMAEDDAAFYWQSPDKDSRMTLFKVWPYYSPDRLQKYDVPEIAAVCRRYELHKNYPYSCLLAVDSYDFGLPEMENVEGIKKWNEQFLNPLLVSGTFDMYFDDLKTQQEKESFKIFDKDSPNAWADMDLSDVEYANKARKLNSGLPTVEKWATIASAVSTCAFPWIDIFQAYHGLLMWAEHTNGAYAEGPIYAPPSLEDQSAANAAYYEIEQEMHRDLVRESEFFKEKAESIAFRQLESQITTVNNYTLVVSNPLVRQRSCYVSFEIPEGKGLQSIIDNSTGKKVPFQYSKQQRALFYASEVPSLGYKTYTLEFEKSEKFITQEQVEAPRIETDFYIVQFDSRSGGIVSLFDKKLNRELVDQNAGFRLNEYYFERFESNDIKEGKRKFQPGKAVFKVHRGPLADIVISEVEAEGARNITQTVTIYKNSNRIDFETEFDKDDSGRTLDDYRTYSLKGKEALFYCLPFNVPDFTIKHELAGGIMEPIEDQFKGSSTDYYAIQNFSDISNKAWGITLATIEPNLVEYGKPRPAHWNTGNDYESIMLKADKSHFYLYLLNNMFFTNIRQTQPGLKSFKWSVRSHQGNWQEGKAYQFGSDIANPLTAFIITGKKEGTLSSTSNSFVETDTEDILCTTIKPAESNGEGYIMRFAEVSGREQTVNVKTNFIENIESVNFTNLVEVDRDYPLEMLGANSFKFIIPAFGLRTVRIVPAKVQLPEIRNLNGIAESDRRIKLSWELTTPDSGKIAYFKVFRSLIPDFEPSLKTYVNNTEKPEFTDEPVLNVRGWQNNNLEPATKYYYKVQVVGKNNRAGVTSPEISVETLKSDAVNQLPNQVLGLVSTLISPITNFNYVGLYFYTNVESDINKYVIYRSKEKGFTPGKANVLAVMDVTQNIEHVTPHGFGNVIRPLKAYNRQLFIDENVESFTTYYYKVAAMDDAGRLGIPSLETSTTTGISQLVIHGETSFRDSALVEILNPNNNDWKIRYTLDGTLPLANSPQYTAPFVISEDITVTASLFVPDNDMGAGTAKHEFKRLNDYSVIYHTRYDDRWKSTGDMALIDNFKGDIKPSKNWQGFEVNDLDVTIDLKKLSEVKSVEMGCLQNLEYKIFFPSYIEVFTSEDGKDFKFAGRQNTDEELQGWSSQNASFKVMFPSTNCRYIKVFAKNIEYTPSWHNFPGKKAWLFVDEIIIK